MYGDAFPVSPIAVSHSSGLSSKDRRKANIESRTGVFRPWTTNTARWSVTLLPGLRPRMGCRR